MQMDRPPLMDTYQRPIILKQALEEVDAGIRVKLRGCMVWAVAILLGVLVILGLLGAALPPGD